MAGQNRRGRRSVARPWVAGSGVRFRSGADARVHTSGPEIGPYEPLHDIPQNVPAHMAAIHRESRRFFCYDRAILGEKDHVALPPDGLCQTGQQGGFCKGAVDKVIRPRKGPLHGHQRAGRKDLGLVPTFKDAAKTRFPETTPRGQFPVRGMKSLGIQRGLA